MYVVMGGTGHVGSATAEALLRRGESLAIVTSNASHAIGWQDKDVEIIEANVDDVSSLRTAFQRGRRTSLLNPPADTTRDTDKVERQTVSNILAALDGSGLEKVVAGSTGAVSSLSRKFGARPLHGVEKTGSFGANTQLSPSLCLGQPRFDCMTTEANMGVTGIGGFFFRAQNPEAVSAWYAEHLGIGTDPHGMWQTQAGPCVFAPFNVDTDYFAADRRWMLNLRVDDLDGLLTTLRAASIEITTNPEWDMPGVGRFARIHDPEGNPIELWQPDAAE